MPKVAEREDEEQLSAESAVIPDVAAREQALSLISEIEIAVRRIEDTLDLDDDQQHIIDRLILPKAAELKGILEGSAMSPAEATEDREKSLLGIGTLIGFAQALLITFTGVAYSDEAIDNLRQASDGLPSLVRMIMEFFRQG
jgi:hypothetical protein